MQYMKWTTTFFAFFVFVAGVLFFQNYEVSNASNHTTQVAVGVHSNGTEVMWMISNNKARRCQFAHGSGGGFNCSDWYDMP